MAKLANPNVSKAMSKILLTGNFANTVEKIGADKAKKV